MNASHRYMSTIHISMGLDKVGGIIKEIRGRERLQEAPGHKSRFQRLLPLLTMKGSRNGILKELVI